MRLKFNNIEVFKFYSILFVILLNIFKLNNQLLAAPRLISDNYPNCTSCHIQPMGSGILNDYGMLIDEAQSIRGEFFDAENRSKFLRYVTDDITIYQDFRTVIGINESSNEDFSDTFLRHRYANSTRFKSHRIYNEIVASSADNENNFRFDKLLYELSISKDEENTKLIHVGEDFLPSGLGNGVRNKIVQIDGKSLYSNHSNLQLKYYDIGNSHLFSAFTFLPSSTNSDLDTIGAGSLYEKYIRKNFALGGKATITKLDTVSSKPLLATLSSYSRIGFLDKFSTLGEISFATDINNTNRDIYQASAIIQQFYQYYEWLVPSIGIGSFQDLEDSDNSSSNLSAGLYLRISRNFNINTNFRNTFSGDGEDRGIIRFVGKF